MAADSSYNFGGMFQDATRMMAQGYKDAAELRMRDQIRQDAYNQNQAENKRNDFLMSRFGSQGVDAAGNPILENNTTEAQLLQWARGRPPGIDPTTPEGAKALKELQQLQPGPRIISVPGRGFDMQTFEPDVSGGPSSSTGEYASLGSERSPAGVHDNGFNYAPLNEDALDKLNSPNLGQFPGPLSGKILVRAGIATPSPDPRDLDIKGTNAYGDNLPPEQRIGLIKAMQESAPPRQLTNAEKNHTLAMAMLQQLGGHVLPNGEIKIPSHAEAQMSKYYQSLNSAGNPLASLVGALAKPGQVYFDHSKGQTAAAAIAQQRLDLQKRAMQAKGLDKKYAGIIEKAHEIAKGNIMVDSLTPDEKVQYERYLAEAGPVYGLDNASTAAPPVAPPPSSDEMIKVTLGDGRKAQVPKANLPALQKRDSQLKLGW